MATEDCKYDDLTTVLPALQITGPHCLAHNKFQDFPGPQKNFLGPCRSPQQRVNDKTSVTYSTYKSATVASILQRLSISNVVKQCFITVRTNHEN